MTHTFPAFATDGVQKLSGAEGYVVLSTATAPACIAKYPAWAGSGRTAWVSEFPLGQDDTDLLLTSLVLWASEQRRLITDTQMGQEAAKVSMYTMPKDTARADYMFMPMEVVLRKPDGEIIERITRNLD